MKRLYIIFFLAGLSVLHGCSDDNFPVPPASTVPLFSNTIDNNEFAPATVTFKNESIIPARAGTVTYTWNFGDGTSSTAENPTHLYSTPGAYTVNLVVISNTSMEIVNVSKVIQIKDPNASGTPLFFTSGTTVYTALINEQDPIAESIGITSLQDSYGMAIDTVNDKLYIADFDGEKILVSNLDGSDLQDFRTNIGDPDAVAIDYDGKMIYWDTSNGIRRASLEDDDVTQFEEFVTGQANDPEGVAIDPVNRVLYWNNYDGGVWKKNLSGSGEALIIPATGGGGSLIVIGDHIFFDDFVASGDIYIKTANLDGSGVATVATGVSRVIFGMAYDKNEEKLYWTDRNKSTIMRANLDGSSPDPWYVGTSARGLVIGEKK